MITAFFTFVTVAFLVSIAAVGAEGIAQPRAAA